MAIYQYHEYNYIDSDLGLKLDGPTGKNSLLKRLSGVHTTVRATKSKKRTSWRKMIFRLNVYPQEHSVTEEKEIIFEEIENEVAQLKAKVVRVEEELTTVQQKLTKSAEETAEEKAINSDLVERNACLHRRLAAVEQEADASQQANDILQVQVNALEAEQKRAEAEKSRVLGRKPVEDIGPDALKSTKSAYKRRFREDVNRFGKNRGLTLDQIILKNAEGKGFVTN